MSNLKGSTIPNSNNSDVKKKDELLNRTALVGKILRNAENNRNFQDLKVQFFFKNPQNEAQISASGCAK